jgi:hypothetical protein
LEWYISTLTGQLNWEAWSGSFVLEDDDFNFTLVPNGLASLAAANGGSLGLEFRADESIDNFSSPFWRQVHDYGVGSDSRIGNLVGNKFAVITGLLGIDAVHGGKTELHPVYSMAVLESAAPARDGGIDETWQMFLINTGVGGGCSTNTEHQWLGLSDGNSANGWYFITLPMPSGATTSSPVSHDLRGPAAGTFVEQQYGSFVYLGFQLPMEWPPTSVDGSVTIHFNVSSDARAMAKTKEELFLHKPVEEEVSWSDAVKKLDPAVQQKLKQSGPKMPAIRTPPRPHTAQLNLDTSPATKQRVLALITEARKRPPARAHVVANPGLQKQITNIEEFIRTLLLPNLGPLKMK